MVMNAMLCFNPTFKAFERSAYVDLTGFCPNVGIPDLSMRLYLQLLTRNPNMRSTNAKFGSQEGKSGTTNVREIVSLELLFIGMWDYYLGDGSGTFYLKH